MKIVLLMAFVLICGVLWLLVRREEKKRKDIDGIGF